MTPCRSIYVKFQVTDDKGVLRDEHPKEQVYFVIWTTTTWTIPGNVAVCLGPEYEYTLVKTGDQYLVMAKELADVTMRPPVFPTMSLWAASPAKSWNI